jgi:uncharacterized protein (TIGR02145 family)
MNKKLFLSLAFAFFPFLSCINEDERGEVPCSFCGDENKASTNYGYCFYSNQCIYMSQSSCDDYYGSRFYASQSDCNSNISLSGSSGYCLYSNQCIYMSQYDCYNFYGGNFYSSSSACQSARSSSSSFYPSIEGSSSSFYSSSSSSYPYGSYSSSSITIIKDSFTDNRDYKKYNMVRIGSQWWMAENLNYNVSGSRCYGDDTGSDTQGYCEIYGRLYDWATAMTVCPAGWHLPSDAEWTTLTNYVGSNAGTKLKAASGWYGDGNGTDDFGFAALPGGNGDSDGGFFNAGDYGYWWSASEGDASYAYSRNMDYLENVYASYGGKSGLFSVRCLQD